LKEDVARDFAAYEGYKVKGKRDKFEFEREKTKAETEYRRRLAKGGTGGWMFGDGGGRTALCVAKGHLS